MTHSFAAHFGQRHFNAAFFTDYSAVLQTLVLTAQALIVFHRAKNLGAKQAIALRFLSTVVDRLRLLDFAVGPGVNLLGTGKADADGIKMLVLIDLIQNVIKRRIHFA